MKLPPPTTLPQTRAECEAGPRPCPHWKCRHHLLLDTAIDGPGGGHRTIGDAIKAGTAPDILPALKETCSLDIAARGAHTLVEVADYLGGLSRERIRQIESGALLKVARALFALDPMLFDGKTPSQIRSAADKQPTRVRRNARAMRATRARRLAPSWAAAACTSPCVA